MVENVEPIDENKKTIGFGVNGVPIWLFKELAKEAKKYYADIYWPVIVGWHRKAKEYEYIMRGGLPSQDDLDIKDEFVVDEKPKEKTVALMGGNVGRGGRK